MTSGIVGEPHLDGDHSNADAELMRSAGCLAVEQSGSHTLQVATFRDTTRAGTETVFLEVALSPRAARTLAITISRLAAIRARR